MTYPRAIPRPGLSSLEQVPLVERYEQMWQAAKASCTGPAPCRARLCVEAYALFALAQISGRMDVHWLDLTDGLRALVRLEAPIPCMGNGELIVTPFAMIGLIYSRDAILLPQPGYAFVRILAPTPVWLSNVRCIGAEQVMCLGSSIPAGTPVKDLIVMTFGALTLQSIQLDLADPAGLLNPEAAIYWQHNTAQIPMTHESFIRQEAQDAH